MASDIFQCHDTLLGLFRITFERSIEVLAVLREKSFVNMIRDFVWPNLDDCHAAARKFTA